MTKSWSIGLEREVNIFTLNLMHNYNEANSPIPAKFMRRPEDLPPNIHVCVRE